MSYSCRSASTVSLERGIFVWGQPEGLNEVFRSCHFAVCLYCFLVLTSHLNGGAVISDKLCCSSDGIKMCSFVSATVCCLFSFFKCGLKRCCMVGPLARTEGVKLASLSGASGVGCCRNFGPSSLCTTKLFLHPAFFNTLHSLHSLPSLFTSGKGKYNLPFLCIAPLYTLKAFYPMGFLL